MVFLTLIILLIIAALAVLPEVRAKLREVVTLRLLMVLFVWQCLVAKFQHDKHNTVGENTATKGILAIALVLIVVSLTREPRRKAEQRLTSLSYWIPRKYREAITGDILEDCHEMRELGFTEWRIRIHVLWQLTIAVIALWPEAIGSVVAAVVRRVWKTKQ